MINCGGWNTGFLVLLRRHESEGNTDDNARNHSAFWDGKNLSLTPAYDISPQQRAGEEATQAMAINGMQGNYSTLVNVLSITDKFLLTDIKAREIVQQQIDMIHEHWFRLCREVKLSQPEQKRL